MPVRQRHGTGATIRPTHVDSGIDFGGSDPSGALYSSQSDVEPTNVTGIGQGSVTDGAIAPPGLSGSASLAPGSIDLAKFASTIRPVALVNPLPTLPDTLYPIGCYVSYTAASPFVLYKNQADVWVKAIGPGDIQADSITAAQIAAGAIATSELAVTLVLPGSLANEVGATPGVFIDSTGMLIRQGKLTLQDEFGLTTMSASGFSGSWNDFVALGLYNGRFSAGTAGSLPAGRTASLPYWSVGGGTGIYTKTVDALLPVVKVAFSGLGSATLYSDAVAVYPQDIMELAWVHRFNTAAGSLTIQPFIYWFKEDGSASATPTSTMAGETVTSTFGIARGPADAVPVPADARSARVYFVFSEATTHSASNWIYLYSASLMRKTTGALPAERHGDQFTLYATIGGTLNNYNPGSIDTTSMYQLNTSSNVYMTGLIAPRYGKRIITIQNVGAGIITLAHQHASSTAANRFYISNGANHLTLQSRGMVVLYYDDIGNWWVPLRPGSKAPVQTFYGTAGSPFTWTIPNDMTRCKVRLVGGGGGGGGADTTGAGQYGGGAGGGGGGYAEKWFQRTDFTGTTCTLTVGAGGAAGANTGGTGGTGGNTTFAGSGITTVQGNGGAGGESAVATAGFSIRQGGLGGTTSGSDLGINGGDGGTCILNASRNMLGAGGGTPLGGSSRPGGTDAGDTGRTGISYGGGGSGAHNGVSVAGKTGGVGAGGAIIVEEYYD